MNEYTSGYPADLFQSGEEIYFKKLEKLAIPLRQSAREMFTFIDKLDQPSTTLNALKRCFAQLESIPIKHIYKGLEEVSSHLIKMDFLNPPPILSTANFISFMTIQNQLCTQLNELMTHAMRIKN